MAQKSVENFPVAIRALPKRTRGHLMAVYGYARFVDDIGDEFTGDRLTALDWVQAELQRARTSTATHPVMQQLSSLLQEVDIADAPFVSLIEANRLDQHKTRYLTQAELAKYCALSANPIGQLVLAIFEVATPKRINQSNAVCTGLQIIEHLQDIGEDYTQKKRIYMPAELMQRFGVVEEDLSASQASPKLCKLVAHHCDTARGLLLQGKPLLSSLSGWAKIAVAGYIAGGLAALDAIAAANYDVLSKLRAPSRVRTMLHVGKLLVPISRDTMRWRS